MDDPWLGNLCHSPNLTHCNDNPRSLILSKGTPLERILKMDTSNVSDRNLNNKEELLSEKSMGVSHLSHLGCALWVHWSFAL